MKYSILIKMVALLLLFLGHKPAFAVPIENVVTDSGQNAYIIRDHETPLISISIGFKAGWSYDPPGKEGLALFAEAMMNEGAGELSSQQFQEALADNGIELSTDSGADDFIIRLSFLTEKKEQAAHLLHLALTQLRLDDAAMERNRQQLLAALSQDRNDPDKLAGDALQHLMFPDHAYGRAGAYTESSIKSINPADLRAFARSNFVKNTANIAAVGDISEKALKEFLDKVFTGIPEKGSMEKMADTEMKAKAGIGIIKLDIPQSAIVFSAPAIALKDPDFYAAYILNYILGGGGFSSRLMQEIRVKRGLSYGIDTDLINRDHASFLFGSVKTKRSSTKETIDLIKSIWKEMQQEGPTQEELERAKTYIIGYYPRNFATLESSASLLLGLQLDKLGIDYPEKRRAYFEAVTLEDVRRVARRMLDPDKLTFVIVGMPEDIKANIDIPAASH